MDTIAAHRSDSNILQWLLVWQHGKIYLEEVCLVFLRHVRELLRTITFKSQIPTQTATIIPYAQLRSIWMVTLKTTYMS